jgi:hypothetical protein
MANIEALQKFLYLTGKTWIFWFTPESVVKMTIFRER